MADRYTRIYIDDKEKYCVGAPIIISACALLNDNKNKNVVAQIKLKNIGEKVIKAVKVLIAPLDTAGRSLGDRITYSYLDLNVKRDEYFGSQNAIPMPDSSTRAIDVKITEIILSDNTVIDTSQKVYKLIPERRTLSSLFDNEEMVKQYKIKTTDRANFEPIELENLWLCACGAINACEEDYCHICRTKFSEQINSLNSDILSREAHTRIEKENNNCNPILRHAIGLMASHTISDYEAALSELKKIKDYKNANELIKTCEQSIGEIKKQEKNEEQNKLIEIQVAGKATKNRKIIAAIATPIVIACIVACIVFVIVLTKHSAQATVGDVVCFGSYEQDNKMSNVKEDIEWLVLAKEGDKALVISKYALDCQEYNTSYTSVTWETCSLRKWLNGTFLNAAFSSAEQSSIVNTTVTVDKNPSYSTSPGNNTTDKVFLLSITEVNKYFKSYDARKCAPTDYAIAQGTDTSSSDYTDGRATCWWWLRSPGGASNLAAYVISDGSADYEGFRVDLSGGAVRPAMWIDIGNLN